MKKYPITLIFCLLLAVTGCGNDEPTATTETTVPTETTQTAAEITEAPTTITTIVTTVTKQPETTEKVMEVTMDNIDEIFSLEYPTDNYENYNPLFLYCFYDKPSEMDLKTVLYHGMGEEYNYRSNELSEEELLNVGMGIGGVEIVGAVKIPKDKLNEYLLKKTGLTIDEFDNTDMKFEYNEQYDAYYGYCASDTILQPIDFISVEMNDDVYTAVYTTMGPLTFSDITCEVKFKVNDGVVQFISNKQID